MDNISPTHIKLTRRLPLLIIDSVLFPGASIRIPVTTYRNMNMVKSHLLNRTTLSSAIIGVVPKEVGTRNNDEDRTNMHPVGTAGIVIQVTGTNWPRPAYTLLVTGLCRFRLESLAQESPYLIGTVRQLDKLADEDLVNESNPELSDLMEKFREQSAKLIDMLDLAVPAVVRLKRLLNTLPVQSLPDICAAMVKASHEERLQILDAVDLPERFRKTLPLLIRQIESLRILQKARKGDNTNSNQSLNLPRIPHLPRHQRVDFDDEEDEEADEIVALERKIKAIDMPEQPKKVAMKELQRLKKMPAHMPEHALIRTYLELMTDLPWSKSSPETIDLAKSREDLDKDHYGLEKLKERVLEYLAVRQLKNSLKGPILCFVGPPGVGKTSVGRSIAKSLKREFHRISLGGVCDQADIRGHRRTYIGSMPGRIIQGLKTVGVKNPVFLMDEIDKMASGLHGDPAAALLEVLDPEQNCNFTDHYLNVPFDLSQVLFIATANTLKSIPAALLDRMEVIFIPGYTQDEKLKIAQDHLLPKVLSEHGLTSELVHFDSEALRFLISKYTREAGVRGLERKMAALCRAVAVRVVGRRRAEEKASEPETPKAEGNDLTIQPSGSLQCNISYEAGSNSPVIIDECAVEDILGPPIYDSDITSTRVGVPGVSIGLAWTPTGGGILFIEATKIEGSGSLTLTGQLGDVMKESAQIALNWVHLHAHQYGVQSQTENFDVHIHVPAGAVEKEGPSAGIALVTALISLFTGKIVSPHLAMTGEITLRGLVLPVGGIKEKVLGGHRNGIRRFILPKRNEKDLREIPSHIKDELEFNLVSTIDQVLTHAFSEPIDLPLKVETESVPLRHKL
ncbi:lon protease homolog 2, peroxisomal-like [Brevipalpus obovatus]|uniref:lon protease homolog 2, peroxisomal-like n=1 Tax=Brevipalpus obovatus TaxID=246614 RepID=UPI003D9F8485